MTGAQHLVFTGPFERSRHLLAPAPTLFCSDPVWPKADLHALVRSPVTAFVCAELTEDSDAPAWLSSPERLPGNVMCRSAGH